MDPQLKALLDKYAAAGATDDEIRQAASDWQTQNAQKTPVAAGGSAADPLDSAWLDAQRPGRGARIARNIAAMRAQGASEQDIESYLTQHEGLTASSGSVPDTALNVRNIMRSLMQGASFNLGDSKKLPASVRINADAESAFKNAHPYIDFASKLVGGALAPAAAVAAAPEVLGGLSGAALLGAGAGAVGGAAEGTDVSPMDRLENAGKGGAAGMAGGAAGYGLSKAASGAVNAVLDRINPARSIARTAKTLMTPEDALRLARLNQMAPGSASIATATTPAGAGASSRFLSMARGVGANPEAASAAEQHLLDQTVTITAARNALGNKMNALDGSLPLDADVRAALAKVHGVLGNSNTPAVPASDFDANPLGIEKSAQNSQLDAQAPALSIADAREALSRLRYLSRQAAKRGTDANGPTTYEINGARSALQNVLYERVPQFRDIDSQYSALMDQQRQVGKLLKAVRDSRANYAGNAAYGVSAGSLGGSLPRGYMSVLSSAMGKAFPVRPAAADAVARYIIRPGGQGVIDQLTANVPSAHPIARQLPAIVSATSAPTLRGLLFSPDSTSDFRQQPQ